MNYSHCKACKPLAGPHYPRRAAGPQDATPSPGHGSWWASQRQQSWRTKNGVENLSSSHPQPLLSNKLTVWCCQENISFGLISPRPGSALGSCVTSGRWPTLSGPLGETHQMLPLTFSSSSTCELRPVLPSPGPVLEARSRQPVRGDVQSPSVILFSGSG